MIKNKKIKLLFILMACFLLTACGIQAKDDLNIDGNFKGKRVVNISLDQETLQRVNGGNDAIKKFLNDYIESPFTYEIKKEEENFLNLDLSFAFNDLGEYKTIVKNLYEKSGKSFEDEINFLYSDSEAVFSKGIEFEDPSDIKLMLGFLEQKLVDEGLVKEADVSNIWESVEKNVRVNDEEIVKDSSTRAAYNNIEYIGPYQHMISISKSNLSDNYNMRIRLAFKNKDLDHLGSDWKEKLFDKNLVTNIEPIKTDDITIEVFDVENKDLSEIEKVLEKLFGNKVSLSIDIRLDKKRLVKVVKIEQTIAGDSNSKSNYEFIYYADPLSVEKHIKDMNKSNIEEKYLSSDYLEYVKLEEEFPIVFDKLSIVTKISKNSLSRTLTVSKDNDYNKELVNDFLISFLDDKGIKYKNNESDLIIEYSGDEFEETNSKLFTANPIVDIQSLGFFKDLVNYSEDSSLININFNTIEYSYKYPMLASETRQVENIFTTNNNWINAQLHIEVFKISAIVILFILLIGIIILMILARKKMKKENKSINDYLSKGKEKFDTAKEKAKETKIDIEDKVNEKTSMEDMYDENNINIDKVLEDLIDSINQD